MVAAALALGLGPGTAFAGWEEMWRLGDGWTYRAGSWEIPGPYTMLPHPGDYTLTITLVAGEWGDPFGVVMPVWVWTFLVEHDRYGFPVSAEERAYVVGGAKAIRWPLPTLFLWSDVDPRPEEGAARVGVRPTGTEPTVWEWWTPLEEAGEVVAKLLYRVTLESIGSDTLEVAGKLMAVQGVRCRAETRVEYAGRRPTVRIHDCTAWGTDEVRNCFLVVGKVEENGQVVREYRLELMDYTTGVGAGVDRAALRSLGRARGGLTEGSVGAVGFAPP